MPEEAGLEEQVEMLRGAVADMAEIMDWAAVKAAGQCKNMIMARHIGAVSAKVMKVMELTDAKKRR